MNTDHVGRIKDDTLRELLELLIVYRKEVSKENQILHIGIKTKAGTAIVYIDCEEDAQGTVKNLKKLLQIEN